MKNVFIETQNVLKFRAAVHALEDAENGLPGLALAWGQAGRGKTLAAENYHAEHGGIYLRVWQDWTQRQFLHALAFEVCGTRPHSAAACKTRIVEELDRQPQTIFIDEADRLHLGRIEDLRDIHDASGAPMVLIGEEGLQSLAGSRRRIWSRVTQEVEFGPVCAEDVTIYAMEAAGLSLAPEAVTLIIRKAGGDFRLVRNLVAALERAARAQETDYIDEAFVQKVKLTRRQAA